MDNDQEKRVVGTPIFGRGRYVPLLVIVVALAALACTAPPEDDATTIVQESVHGLVSGVEAQSLLALESLDLMDETGKTWHFEANGKTFASFTASHLKEHMLLGLRVTVVFHIEGDVLVVDDVTD